MTTFEIFCVLFGFCSGALAFFSSTYFYCLLTGKVDSFRKIFWS